MVRKLKLSDKHAPSFSENFTVGAAMLGIPSSVNISYPFQLDIIVNYIKNEFAMTLVHVPEKHNVASHSQLFEPSWIECRK